MYADDIEDIVNLGKEDREIVLPQGSYIKAQVGHCQATLSSSLLRAYAASFCQILDQDLEYINWKSRHCRNYEHAGQASSLSKLFLQDAGCPGIALEVGHHGERRHLTLLNESYAIAVGASPKVRPVLSRDLVNLYYVFRQILELLFSAIVQA